MIRLHKIFKLNDIEGNQRLSLAEFKKALRDFRLDNNIQDKDIDSLFNLHDRRRVGLLNYLDFLKVLREELNEFRRDLVERVFIIMDADDDGLVDINEIKACYNAAKHPEVMQGKKSEAAA